MAKKGGHHGGAWKVAYADFVTAMMALFLVLWLTAQDQKIKEAVERAFRHPFISLTKGSTGLMPAKNKDVERGNSGKFSNSTTSTTENASLRRLQQEISKSLFKTEEDQNSVRFNLTPEGLRITIFDRTRKPIFEPHSDTLTEYGAWILSTVAWAISRYETFAVEIEGHTEQGYRPARKNYTGWELSTDRANSGRRKLLEHGVGAAQFKKVAGFSDTVPLPDTKPDDPLNRRITLLLRVKPDHQQG